MAIYSLFLILLGVSFGKAFQLPNFFANVKAPVLSAVIPNAVAFQKLKVIDAISGTQNGKLATPEQQANVLSLVRKLETNFPQPPNLLSDPSVTKILDGVWYLQYTSPSQVGDSDAFPDAWKPAVAEKNVNRRPFEARGSISAQGISVDTSNRVVTQTIDTDNARVTNDIELDWGSVQVSGAFAVSPMVSNRVLVTFDTALINVINGPSLNLGFVFAVLSFIRRTKVNGWLETTFVDADMRIGRGDKGTMFVLTRDRNAVTP